MREAQKIEILDQLRQGILRMQGLKDLRRMNIGDALDPIRAAFPNHTFPVGAVHEFICSGSEGTAATTGFIAGVLTSLIKRGGVSVWITASQTVFPVALKSFNIEPDHIIFINLENEKDVMWAMNEALRCESLTAVIGELSNIDFKNSRRLQLAVEQSMVTGFVMLSNARRSNSLGKQNQTACVSRWTITPVPSQKVDDLPGLGYPRWNVELLKIRNGRPGAWQLAWENGRLCISGGAPSQVLSQQRRVG